MKGPLSRFSVATRASVGRNVGAPLDDDASPNSSELTNICSTPPGITLFPEPMLPDPMVAAGLDPWEAP